MRRSGILIALCIAALLSAPAQAAQEIRPLERGSYKEIITARQGKPFIVNFWSLTCSYCVVELEMFRKLLRKHPRLDLVLISADTPEDKQEVAAMLAKHSLGRAEAWVFADSFAERLRFEVDRRWQGELPRTYFFSPGHEVTAVSGKLEYEEVEQWVKEQHAPR